MAEGVEERRRKRKPSCNGVDRGSATRNYPARKDFRRGLNGRETLERLELPEMLDAELTGEQRQTVTWSGIDWTATEAVVKRLQGRIYRAAAAGNRRQVKNLQKLLVRS